LYYMGNTQCCESAPRKPTGDGSTLPDSKKPVKCYIQKAGPYSPNYKAFTNENLEWMEFVKNTSGALKSRSKSGQGTAADDRLFTLEKFVDCPGGTRETLGSIEIASPDVTVSENDTDWTALTKARVEVKSNGHGTDSISAAQLSVKVKCGKDQKHDSLQVVDSSDANKRAYTVTHRYFTFTCSEFQEGVSSDDFRIDLETSPGPDAYDGSVIMLAFIVACTARPTDQLRKAVASAIESIIEESPE
ncbi:hypothetical protein FOL47_008295, partial [Perkinsus chesapeaki]